MDKKKWSLVGSVGLGVGLGAGLMYLLDPQRGGGRRALARDKTVSALKTGGNTALKTGKNLGNRTKGLVQEAGSRLRQGKVGTALTAAGLSLLAGGFAKRNGRGNGKDLLSKQENESLRDLGIEGALSEDRELQTSLP